MYDQQPETPDPIKMAAIMATENCSMEDCCQAAKCIRDLFDEVKLLRDLGVRQRSEIEELNSMADAVEVLRDIGKTTGCGHVDDPDGRRQLVNCVESTIDKEKQRRVYYQDIAYSVCNQIDRVFTPNTVCGTVDTPTTQVQERMKLIFEYRDKLEDRIEVLEQTLRAVLVETNFISLAAARDYISEVLQVGPYSS